MEREARSSALGICAVQSEHLSGAVAWVIRCLCSRFSDSAFTKCGIAETSHCSFRSPCIPQDLNHIEKNPCPPWSVMGHSVFRALLLCWACLPSVPSAFCFPFWAQRPRSQSLLKFCLQKLFCFRQFHIPGSSFLSLLPSPKLCHSPPFFYVCLVETGRGAFSM